MPPAVDDAEPATPAAAASAPTVDEVMDALGNVIDRLRLGYVIDFITVHWGDHFFPSFNVADSSITIGAALLLLDAWLDAR